MDHRHIGFALCGSFCTHARALETLEVVKARFGDVTGILSDASAGWDTRFGTAQALRERIETVTGHGVIDSVNKAEPIGPKALLDALVICPCTGNTLGKLAAGIADTPVTMAAKSHLRNGRPVVIAVSTNDGLASSAKAIGALLDKKNVYFVPLRQDDPAGKPTSLVADFSLVPDAVSAALEGRQLQPVLLGPAK